MDDYQFLITNLLTGRTVEEFSPASFSWNELLNRPGSGSCTVRIDDPKTTQGNFDSWRNAIWCMRNGTPQWGGIMGSVSPIASTRALTVPIYGFPEYARWRILRGVENMYYINPFKINTIEWSNIHPFLIAKDMYDHMNFFPNGNIGIDVVWDGDVPEDVERTITYYTYEQKYIGDAFEELGDAEDVGFDWRPVFSIVDGKPKCDIKLSISQGIARPYVLEFDYDPGNPNLIDFDASSTDRPANSVFAAGEGEGDAMLVAHVEDPDSAYPLMDSTVSYKDVKDIDTLTAHANQSLSRNRVPIPTVTGKLDQNAVPQYYNFTVGDYMRVRVNDGWLHYDDTYRVTQKTIVFSPELNIDCTISMELVGA